MKAATIAADLMKDVEKRRTQLTSLRTLLVAIQKTESYDAIGVAGRLERLLKNLLPIETVRSTLVELERAVSDDSASAALQLETLVREICNRRGWTLDGEWPELFVERAISVAFAVEKRRLSVSNRVLAGAASQDIEKTLAGRVQTLLPRGFAPEKFIALLADGYDAAARGSGGETPILDVYRHALLLQQPQKLWRDASAQNFVEMSVEQFRARLTATLAAHQTRSPDGRELRLLAPIDPKDALFVYQPAEKRFGFIGRIQFVPGPTAT